tara:strand:- start:2718 stop:3170 length:453 start_codon:yes stop_codon:yes gene_type:complete
VQQQLLLMRACVMLDIFMTMTIHAHNVLQGTQNCNLAIRHATRVSKTHIGLHLIKHALLAPIITIQMVKQHKHHVIFAINFFSTQQAVTVNAWQDTKQMEKRAVFALLPHSKLGFRPLHASRVLSIKLTTLIRHRVFVMLGMKAQLTVLN